MKVNKWTLGLAAVGLVTLPSVLQAEEKLAPVNSAVAGTIISGYVNTAAQWNFGTGNSPLPGYIYNTPGKQDGFSLNVVKLSLEKPLDEGQWAAGYKADLLFGPDANVFASNSEGSGSDFAIRQAYVNLRTPVGNGLDFKMGVFDSIVGYESHDAGNNPNYTRSYGTTIEPHTHTGLLASYRFSELVNASIGIANTMGPQINEQAWQLTRTSGSPYAESYKAYMASLALTAPESMGYLAGSTLYGGIVNGAQDLPTGATDVTVTHYYVGATIATPVKGWRLGAAFDYRSVYDNPDIMVIAGYTSFQATEKLSLHVRGEYVKDNNEVTPVFGSTKVVAFTGTVQYDLWKNVISRLEFRWDHDADGGDGAWSNAGNLQKNRCMLAANIIYKF